MRRFLVTVGTMGNADCKTEEKTIQDKLPLTAFSAPNLPRFLNFVMKGISRSQATLQVHRSEAFITITNNPNVPNPIRVRRWAASQKSAPCEVHKPADQRMNPKPAEVQVLMRGQTTKLYPGDTLQLDGFRNPNRSKYSYALYLLSAVGAMPVGVSARAGAATAPPEVVAAQAIPGNSSGLGDRAGATATKRSRSENDVGSPLSPLSSKSSRHHSPRIPVGGSSVSSREGAASEKPFEEVDAKSGSQRLYGGGGGGEAPLLFSSSAEIDTRLTVPSKRVAESCSVDLPEAGVPAKTTSHVSEPPALLKGAAVSLPEDEVALRDDRDAVGLPTPQTDATPGKHGADPTCSDLPGTGDRAEGAEGESSSSANVSAGPLWSVHDVVELVPRVGKGENKLGGVAHVKRVFEDGSYLVKLVMRESLVSCSYDRCHFYTLLRSVSESLFRKVCTIVLQVDTRYVVENVSLNGLHGGWPCRIATSGDVIAFVQVGSCFPSLQCVRC